MKMGFRNRNIPYGAGEDGAGRGAASGRMLVVKIALLAFFVLVVMRLTQIQVVDSGRYKEIAKRQYEAKVRLPASRGWIFDRNGTMLASNTTFVSFGADPKLVGGAFDTVAARFARAFDKPRGEYREKLRTSNTRFVWLERHANPALAGRVNARDLHGVVELPEAKRLYHFNHVAGQLIGFTDVDNHGISGIELQFDRYLRGKDGHVVMQRDGRRQAHPSADYPRVEPVNGNNIVLTIDLALQAIAEDELRKGIERTGAESGLVVMMDPQTGEVLAVVNYPRLNPNVFSSAPDSAMKNRTITDMFEPGSVFKIVTASAALGAELVSPEEKFFAENGRWVVNLRGGKTRVIEDTHEYGVLTFREAMEVSSNIVMAKVSDRIGAEKFYTTARDFGFGIATGIELPGEVRGELKKPTQWSGATLHSLAFGYEVGVTPIQIAAAYAAVANGGTLMKPFVIRQILDQQHEVISETRPQVIRRAIGPQTARMLTALLTGAVERGTGAQAKVEGLSIAGKTGTSRKVIDGKYTKGNYTVSFAGFFPAADPRLVCLVMLDNPRKGGYTGGSASAPIFRSIAAKVIAVSGRFTDTPQPVITGKTPVAVPDVANMAVDVAESILRTHGFRVELIGDGRVVLRQSPGPGSKSLQKSTVKLHTIEDQTAVNVPEGYAIVPDVRGLTIRRAINRLVTNGLDVDVSGSGVVTAQQPKPGQTVRVGTSVAVQCTPRPVAVASSY